MFKAGVANKEQITPNILQIEDRVETNLDEIANPFISHFINISTQHLLK